MFRVEVTGPCAVICRGWRLTTRINLFWGLRWKGTPCFLDEKWRDETDTLIG